MVNIANITEQIKAMPAKNKVMILAVLAIAIASVVLLFAWIQKEDYQLLYSNLGEEDAGLIIQKLKEQKTPYKTSGGGIMVPSNRVYELRIQLASQGLPQGGGVGFEVFDETNLTMTEFVQKLNYKRALQGELSRTIRSLSEVEQCRVHLAIPEKSLFTQSEERPKASVLVKLRQGRRLSQGQVQGMVHLVSSSVNGLNPKDVAIVDSHGEMLTSGTGETIGMTNDQLDYQRNYEKDMENRITGILQPVVGKGHVKAKVTAVIDFTKIEKTEEKFDPDSQVVRSEQKNVEKSITGIIGGVPGISSNLPGKTAPQMGSQQGQMEKKNEAINYEISKVTSRIINSSGEVKRLSAVVLIDGTYIPQQGSKEKKYTSRSEEDIKQFEEMVKKSIGFLPDRGDEVRVVNMPFEVAPQEDLLEPKTEIIPIIITVTKYIVPLLAVVLLFLFVVRPLVKALTGVPLAQQPSLQLPQTTAEIEKRLEVPAKPAKIQVIEWAKKNPKDATNLIKNWIEEE
ncbi:MAG: flagellar M-ring protein FliF [Deltaproteobacteria bacterium]|jgi:flagellar M-ring protein FliF|nr:MAG: flagellar M-ring protein FliF [Deltaproteobacteria bacterium]